jgi:hypothetical protein
MIQAWRRRPGTLLIAFELLDLLSFVFARSVGPYVDQPSADQWPTVAGQVFWLALDGLLAWRIWRRGRAAWAVLLALTTIPLGMFLVGLFTAGTAWLAFRVVAGTILAAQTVLLMSPAIRKRGGTRYEARPQTDLTND